MSIELSNAQQFISWMNTKSYLNTIAPSAANRFVKRGQVYWCHFGINIGSEMSKPTPRPAVVVSNFKTLDLIHYYTDEVDKYDKLTQYVTHVKADRNKAQDTLEKLKEIISQNGFDEKSQEKIKASVKF